MEIYALHSDYWQSNTILNVFDAELHLVRAVPLGVRANSIFIEDSTFARKNLLIATGDGYSSSSQYELWAVDPVTGADVWHSPPLIGSILPNSLQFVDTDGDGDQEITFGTNYGMHFTR
jgi:outer membrane protein assembly factor BamB